MMFRRWVGAFLLLGWVLLASAHPEVALAQEQDVPLVLSVDSLTTETGVYYLARLDGWMFHPGDDEAFSRIDVDDAGWRSIDPRFADGHAPDDWTGIGWFRFQFRTDASFGDGRPVGMFVVQTGAVEVYLNGEPLITSGQIGTSAETTRARRDMTPVHFTLAGDEDYVLAVRYGNHEIDRYRNLVRQMGIHPHLVDPEQYHGLVMQQYQYVGLMRGLAGGIFGAFALLHLCLFLFYREARENVYFSGFAAGVAIGFVVNTYVFVSDRPEVMEILVLSTVIFIMIACLFAVALAHELFYGSLQRIFYVVTVLGVLALGVFLFFREFAVYAGFGFIGITCLELIRAVAVAVYRRVSGALVVGTGLLLIAAGFIFMSLVNFQIIPVYNQYVGIVPLFGALALVAGMSLWLSRRTAQTRRQLEEQLEQVKTLSEQKLEQERRFREEEVQRRLLEEQYQQKVRELEEARDLQLSMLPDRVPQHPDLAIAARMKTATEVGGDYYDFAGGPGEQLTIVVGDATGHGLRAGTMVTATKSLFRTLDPDEDLVDALQRFSRALKGMDLPKMYMAMLLARWSGDRLEIASAGMPPVYVLRARTGAVETVRLKGMPLGGFPKYPYEQTTVTLGEDDAVVFMTDGLAECFDATGEMLGYDRIPDFLAGVSRSAPADIIEALLAHANRWEAAETARDDMTFVVLQRKQVRRPVSASALLRESAGTELP